MTIQRVTGCPRCGAPWDAIGPDGGRCPRHGLVGRAEIDAARTAPARTITAVSPDAEPHAGRAEILEVVTKWLRIADREAFDVIMATAIAIHLPGDPLWLMVVAPPGGAKTEQLRALSGERIVTVSTLTPNTLISGLKGAEKQDLLPKLDGKLLVIKDFTSILSKKPEDAQGIYSDLREAYDGYLEKAYGSGVGTKSYHSSFGLIAGVTPAIDLYRTVHALLGERFLRVNVVGDDEGAVKRASELEGQEKVMRGELAGAIGGYLARAPEWTDEAVLVEQHFLEQLRALAHLTAALRSVVARDRQHHVLYHPQREVGTRLVKQLQKLAKALANWRERMLLAPEDYAAVRRVALDGVPDVRLRVIRPLLQADDWITTKMIGQSSDVPTETANETLEDLWMLQTIQRQIDGNAYRWAVTDETRRLFQRAAIDLTRGASRLEKGDSS